MMLTTTTVLDVPVRTDEHGIIRVSGTRVTLETIVARYRQGDSPETIHDGFPTVALGDIYAVIAWYLAHQEEVDRYMAEETIAAERWRAEYEATNPKAAVTITKFRALLENVNV